ncbi:MAG: hypothetical protein B7X50_04040 [Alishewanella sp. 34-51-39]|nr:MAG: hypothetical protein B7X50_04040 [Alishewanella sp. 34-51-39]
MLNLHQLSVKRGHNTVINNISAHFTPGQFIALLGENGAGKSTLLSALKLHEFAKRDLSQLSGGQLQRCHIARCLAQLDNSFATPKLLLLDEPTAALDVHQQHRCLQQIKAFANAGNLVLAVLHDLNLAALYADQVLLLDQGHISALGKPAQVSHCIIRPVPVTGTPSCGLRLFNHDRVRLPNPSTPAAARGWPCWPQPAGQSADHRC